MRMPAVFAMALLGFAAPPLLLPDIEVANAQGRGHGHVDHDRGGPGDHGRGPPPPGMHDRGRHEGWYKRGGHVPREYLDRRYIVVDWRHAHLREPPHGCAWIRSDNGDYLLVALATGVIIDILTH
ncbi:probable transmembrane protein [Aerosticca soli]|uniref:Probable transmembrane protein n=2 Tax=Aerosticca soli TaxID=2010829 RepID=A0A2Z6E549_9GAMM|nr:probable transmembrane protein [Aerosticca soli]